MRSIDLSPTNEQPCVRGPQLEKNTTIFDFPGGSFSDAEANQLLKTAASTTDNELSSFTIIMFALSHLKCSWLSIVDHHQSWLITRMLSSKTLQNIALSVLSPSNASQLVHFCCISRATTTCQPITGYHFAYLRLPKHDQSFDQPWINQ